MQVETVTARNQCIRLLQILPQLCECPGSPGIAPGDLKASGGEVPRLVLESTHIVTLPAVEGEMDCPESFQNAVCMDSKCGVALTCGTIRGVNTL
jgi:hypothetical protein